ncbi:MAG: CinA family protein [Solirubrobacterales bacterium]
MATDRDLHTAAQGLLTAFEARRLTIATAESCTGGMVAAALTAIAGSSAVVERGFVTYSNAAKTEMLGVPAALIERHGAVSEEVARAMAAGALAHSRADVAVAITGIAGPGGGSEGKPVGLVHFAAAARTGAVLHRRMVFAGDREAVRRQAALTALALALEAQPPAPRP